MFGEYGASGRTSRLSVSNRFSPVLQHVAERCLAAKSLCRVSARI